MIGGYLGDLMRAVIHFINRWGRTKDRLGDLKQKQQQQQLIDKSKDLLGTPPVPPDGNGHGPAIATPPPPGDGVPGPIDVSTNGNQPQQEPQDQAKGADDHG